MALDERVLDFARDKHTGAVVAIKKDGRPQVSIVAYQLSASEPTIRISTTADRAKTRNVRRDPRVSILVTSEDRWQYAVLEGDAELSAVAADPQDGTVDELVDLYRSIAGEHPDWDDFRRAMVAEKRLVLTLHLTHAYGTVASG
jgi:PPOX class probable F420-dependent enzyme